VERNRAAKQAGLVELESDETCVSVALVGIEFGSRGNEGPEKSGIDGIVQHEEVLPLGGEEGALLSDDVHSSLIVYYGVELRRIARAD
jgi:hypothetical protein